MSTTENTVFFRTLRNIKLFEVFHLNTASYLEPMLVGHAKTIDLFDLLNQSVFCLHMHLKCDTLYKLGYVSVAPNRQHAIKLVSIFQRISK